MSSEQCAPPSTPKEPSSPRPPALGKETTSFFQENQCSVTMSSDLQCILEEQKSGELYKEFLKQEGHDTRVLDFWYLCRGFPRTNEEHLPKVAKLIYEKYVKRIVAISAEIKNDISTKLQQTDQISRDILEPARQEVEAYMAKTTFPHFVQSELFRNKGGGQEPLLPTLHEEPEDLQDGRHANYRREVRKPGLVKMKPEGLYLRSPYAVTTNYHTRYGSVVPPSTQDSEIASVSSGALTDTDAASSVSDSFRRNRKPRRMPMNEDNLRYPAHYVPRPMQVPPCELERLQNPKKFHEQLCEKLAQHVEKQTILERLNNNLNNMAAVDQVAQVECNDDILDQHVSRVFADLGKTPTMSPPVCSSPPPLNYATAPPHRREEVGEWSDYRSSSLARTRKLGESMDSGVCLLTQADHTGSSQWEMDSVLTEAKRRLEEAASDTRTKQHNIKPKLPGRGYKMPPNRMSIDPEDGLSHRKQSRRSGEEECCTVIGYQYGHGSVPYKSKLPGRNITLRQFKSLINRKGNFRYFFKRVSNDFETGVILDDISEDYAVLPLWEGKVFCIIEEDKY